MGETGLSVVVVGVAGEDGDEGNVSFTAALAEVDGSPPGMGPADAAYELCRCE